MNKYEEEIVKKLDNMEIDNDFLKSITNMIEYYLISDIADSNVEKLIFNIIYSITGKEENIKALINTNPFQLNEFSTWSTFLLTFFKDKSFSQNFKRKLTELSNEDFLLRFELSGVFLNNIKNSTKEDIKVNFSNNVYKTKNFFSYMSTNEIDIKNMNLSDEEKHFLLYYSYYVSDLTNILWLSLMLKYKLKIEVNLSDCSIDQVLGVWLLHEQNKRYQSKN